MRERDITARIDRIGLFAALPDLQMQVVAGRVAGGTNVALKTFDDMQDSVKEFNTVFEQLLDNDAIALYPDWPSAGMYDALNSALQGLINGNSTPEQATGEIKAAYEEGKSDLGL